MLDIALWFLTGWAWIIGYTVIGGAVWKAVGSTLVHRYSDDTWDHTHPGPVLSGIFWPIALPVVTPFVLLALLKNTEFHLPKLPKLPVLGKSAEKRVLEYAAAPVIVLSQIVAQRLTREPENLKLIGAYYPEWRWASSDKRLKVEATCFSANNHSRPLRIDQVTLDGKEIEFDKDIILNALTQAVEFKLEKDKADEEAKRQLKALTAVESLLMPEKN